MNSSKNDFLMKNENDENDICYQICIFINHRVCNSFLQFSFDNNKMIIILKNIFNKSL